MTRIDELPPDRRAVLSLILRRGRTYAEIASALQIDEDTVRDHAHGALAELAGERGRALSATDRDQIGDYLLAQQSPAERLVTYDELEGSPDARAFAHTVAGELETVSAATLPDIPAGAGDSQRSAAPFDREPPPRPRPEPSPTPRRREGASAAAQQASVRPARARRSRAPRSGSDRAAAMAALPSSRVGGAIVLGLIVLGAVLAVVLTSTSGGSSPAAKTGAAAAANAGDTASAGATGSVRLNKQIKLTPPAGGNAVGAAAVLSEGSRYVIALAAEHLAPTQGFFYAAWLYNSPGQAYALGKAPSVSSNGQLKPVAQALPPSAGDYQQLLITKETSERPSQPGETVLSGPFSLH